MSITAYPLCWPMGWHRTIVNARKSGKFSKGQRQYSNEPGGSSWMRRGDLSVYEAVQRVQQELERMGVRSRHDIVISTNIETRLDGTPRSDRRAPDDPGVAVYWTDRQDKAPRCIAIDQYDSVAANLAAVAATLDAMRAIERHGGAEIGHRAYDGFKALPAPGQDTATGWRTRFGFEEGARPALDEVEREYRRRASENHPDRGGNPEIMMLLNEARDQARKELQQ